MRTYPRLAPTYPRLAPTYPRLAPSPAPAYPGTCTHPPQTWTYPRLAPSPAPTYPRLAPTPDLRPRLHRPTLDLHTHPRLGPTLDLHTHPRLGPTLDLRPVGTSTRLPGRHTCPRKPRRRRRPRAPAGKSRRRRAYPQQIVTTRLLYCLQDPFAQLSRLQRI